MTEEAIPAVPAEEPVPAAPAEEPSRINRAFAGVGVAVGLNLWMGLFTLPGYAVSGVISRSHPRLGAFFGFLGLLLVIPGILSRAKGVWASGWRKALPLARVGPALLVWSLLCLAFFLSTEFAWLALIDRTLGLPKMDDPLPAIGVLGVVLGAPLGEEVLFRGYGLARIRELGGDRRALLLPAIAFALAHFYPVRLPGTFLMGLFLGWIVLRTGSLWPALLLHVVNNGVAALSVLFMGSQATESTASWTQITLLAVIGLAGLAVLWLPQVRGRIKELAPRPGGGNPETMEAQA